MNPQLRAKYGSAHFPSVNLIPKEIAEKKALRRVQFVAVVAILIAVGVVALGYFGALATKQIAQNNVDDALEAQTAAVSERDAKVGVYDNYRRIETEEYGLTQVGFGEIDYAQLTTAIVGTANDETSFDAVQILGPNGAGFGAGTADPVFGVGGVGSIGFTARATSAEEATALIARMEAVPGIAKVTAVTEAYFSEDGNDYWQVEGTAGLSTVRLTMRLVPQDGIAGINVSETVRLQDPNEEPLPVTSASPSASPSADAAATEDGN
jgi:arginine exporter protein ArgO